MAAAPRDAAVEAAEAPASRLAGAEAAPWDAVVVAVELPDAVEAAVGPWDAAEVERAWQLAVERRYAVRTAAAGEVPPEPPRQARACRNIRRICCLGETTCGTSGT